MLYYKCPSCRTVLANKQVPYENGLKNICNNDKLTEKEQEVKKMKLLDDLYIVNICCRMRMLTYLDRNEILKT